MDWNLLLSSNRLRGSTREQNTLDLRNDFESDFGRVIFSPALRRMHDKTQLFPLITDDNTHTRLTHSLEVATLAKSLGINLCANSKFIDSINYKFKTSNYNDKTSLIRIIPEILSSIALCHDIGNPPFGHFGETVIANYFNDYFKENDSLGLTPEQKLDFTKYNGNAQGFRVITRQQILQDGYGLNLTYAVLSSFLKYPNLANEISPRGYHRKLGVFQSEKDIIEKIRENTGIKNIRHPLAFLMEAGDTISYQLMDIEDGFNKGLYRIPDIYKFIDKHGNQTVKDLFKGIEEKRYNKLDDFNKERTAIVKFRIDVIQYLINFTIENFLKNIEEINTGDYVKELVFDDDKNGVAWILKKFIEENIFSQREVQSLELTGCSVIRGLLDNFVPELIEKPDSDKSKRLWTMISTSLRRLIEFETGQKDLIKIDNYYKLRIIVDFVSGMTDKFALSLYQKLEGIKIS